MFQIGGLDDVVHLGWLGESYADIGTVRRAASHE